MANDKPKANGVAASPSQEDYSNLKFEELQLGVWKLRFALVPPTFDLSPAKQWTSFKAAIILTWDYCRRIFSISPKLFSMFILYKIWSGVETSLALQLSNNLLRAIEERLVTGKSNDREIINAVVLCVVCAMFEAYSYWYYRKRIRYKLETRVTRHYEAIILETNLRFDLPAFKAGAGAIDVSPNEAWWSIQNIIDSLTSALKLVTELLMILHLSLNTGGPLFALLCFIQPLCAGFSVRNIWGQVVLGFINNPHYQRLKSISKMVHKEEYREDLISGGLGRWITDEFRQANQRLGALSDGHPLRGLYEDLFDDTPAFHVFLKVLGELPMMFCAFNVVLHPERFSVSSLAILQQSATTLRNSVRSALEEGREVRKSITKLKKIYKLASISKELKSGNASYPRAEKMESVLIDPRKGMSFQLRDVSFSYVGTQNKKPALNNVSLTIKPGQLVVIVGANGSGKSTIIRILSRLCDPTSGELLIDDLPFKDYRIGDLQKSSVLLSQNNMIYPLSLAENIGLGYPECASDADMLSEAARLGGAQDFIDKLDQGMNTTLKPFASQFLLNLEDEKNHPLYKEMLKLVKEIDVSGGEKQRIVAARSFMRFNSGKVNFVAVDEPSSALDAEGELQLFNNLLSVREGKTMVFVTHRFGHLTKHADLIICMKEGSIVESGTHTELMEKKGEYMSLFNIQAKAFSD